MQVLNKWVFEMIRSQSAHTSKCENAIETELNMNTIPENNTEESIASEPISLRVCQKVSRALQRQPKEGDWQQH